MEFSRAFSKAPWEAKVGYCRALRAGQHIYVTGTAPIDEEGTGVHAPGDAYAQARRCLELIEAALRKLDVERTAIVRTRMFVTVSVPRPVSRAARMSSSFVSAVGVSPAFQVKIWRFHAPPA